MHAARWRVTKATGRGWTVGVHRRQRGVPEAGGSPLCPGLSCSTKPPPLYVRSFKKCLRFLCPTRTTTAQERFPGPQGAPVPRGAPGPRAHRPVPGAPREPRPGRLLRGPRRRQLASCTGLIEATLGPAEIRQVLQPACWMRPSTEKKEDGVLGGHPKWSHSKERTPNPSKKAKRAWEKPPHRRPRGTRVPAGPPPATVGTQTRRGCPGTAGRAFQNSLSAGARVLRRRAAAPLGGQGPGLLAALRRRWRRPAASPVVY